jgi:hypothetical protein
MSLHQIACGDIRESNVDHNRGHRNQAIASIATQSHDHNRNRVVNCCGVTYAIESSTVLILITVFCEVL